MGAKAGGFLSQKHFHPTNTKNLNIIFQNKIINKAKNLDEAKIKLKKLSGKKHKITSCVSVCYKNKQIWSKQQTSTITMKKLNDKQIDIYLEHSSKEILSSVGKPN